MFFLFLAISLLNMVFGGGVERRVVPTARALFRL